MSNKLFTPLQIGAATLEHRLVMAPLTRFRADENHVPTDLMVEYYTQRASVPGTLLITEATFISQQASGYPKVPGIFNDAQVAGWKKITDAVHAKKSYIYCQLWHLGRAADPSNLKSKGLRFVSSSATPMSADSPTPEALTEEEIEQTIKDYASAAKLAIEAGFDGVEIHGANGYLIDQFTQDTCNKRTDKWGGSVENRARFGLEVAKAVTAAVGGDKTGIRLSPFSSFQGMKMADPINNGFEYLVRELKKSKLAYLHLVESRISGNADIEATEKVDTLIDVWDNQSPVLLAGGFKPDSAKKVVDEYPGKEIAVVFGRLFISNPDLPYKIKENIDLVPYDRDTFYNAGEVKGYTTWPFAESFKGQSISVKA